MALLSFDLARAVPEGSTEYVSAFTLPDMLVPLVRQLSY